MISSPIWLSRLPVGSSASRMRGLPDDRAGNRHALLLAARELRRKVVHARRQADLVERGQRQLAAFARRHAPIQQRQLHVVDDRQIGDQVKGLEDESDLAIPDLASAASRYDRDRLAVQRHLVRASARRAVP